jgi:aarF domain-containing kinase
MVEALALDLFILRKWAGFLERVKAVITNQPAYDVQLIDTFGGATYSELDYCNEASNQELFAAAFAEKVPDVRVPGVFRDCTARRVLTSEWIDGIQLAKSSPDVISRLTPVGVRCFLAQLLDIGVFHADPHPGNLLVDTTGKLTLIDFGLCATVEKPATRAMTAGLVHLMAGDVPALMGDAIALEFLDASVNTDALLPIFEKLFVGVKLAAAEGVKVDGPAKLHKTRRKQFTAVSGELNQIFFDYPFQVPDYFALVTRALITLEGIVRCSSLSINQHPPATALRSEHFRRDHPVLFFEHGFALEACYWIPRLLAGCQHTCDQYYMPLECLYFTFCLHKSCRNTEGAHGRSRLSTHS